MKILLVLVVIGFYHCGGSSDSLRVSVNGQEFEMEVQSSSCMASQPVGPAVPGYGGVANVPLICTISYRSQRAIGDYITIFVSDAGAIASDFLGEYVEFSAGLVNAEIVYQTRAEVVSNGAVRFSRISNFAGDRIMADFSIYTGTGTFVGTLNTKVYAGY